MSEVKTGRYSIGEEIYACTFVYENNISISNLFTVLGVREPIDIKFIKLTVKEHYKVSDSYSNELMYDGYVLESPDGTKFTNQFPVANYGQVSDIHDRIFYIDTRGMSEEKASELIKERCKKPYGYVAIDEVFTPMIEAVTLDKDKLSDELAVKLSLLINRFKDNFAKLFPDMDLVTAPLVFKEKDGTERSYPDILETTVVKKEKKEENV